MNVFYGAAIQGEAKLGGRSGVHRAHIAAVKELGHDVYTEHTGGHTRKECVALMEKAMGKLPKIESERIVMVRDKLIEWIESEAEAAVFEVSLPSLGTGVEITHAYLRPKMGLRPIPILFLYEKDFWPNKLSTMLRGISEEMAPFLKKAEYESLEDAQKTIQSFFRDFVPKFL